MMNTPTKSPVDRILPQPISKRNRALLIVIEVGQKEPPTEYTTFDFALDNFIRQLTGLERKSVGKAPYGFIDS